MTQPALPPPGFDDLSPAEKLDYLQALWDRVAEHPEDVAVPAWHQAILAERLAAHRAGQGRARPWDEVRAELLAKLHNGRP